MTGLTWLLLGTLGVGLLFLWGEFVWRDGVSQGCVQNQRRGFFSTLEHRWRVMAIDGRRSSWHPGRPHDRTSQAAWGEVFKELEEQRLKPTGGETRGEPPQPIE